MSDTELRLQNQNNDIIMEDVSQCTGLLKSLQV